jgi:squalene-hopene/tetraprenyl-beta-curcumene cyclase
MTRTGVIRCAGAALAAVMLMTWAGSRHKAGVSASTTWNASAAAHHLDDRQTWWMKWPRSQRDHETACVSCHTTLPYAMARPSLRHTLGETGPSATEVAMLAFVNKRVSLWKDVQPFYSDAGVGPHKTAESRGTESVLNALILARYDLPQHVFGTTTQAAFAAMWAEQLKDGEQAGAWDWLNFKNAPWESNESQYYGAAMAAIAVGMTPAEYRDSKDTREHREALRGYLAKNYAAQPLVNRVVVLWASTTFPGLLNARQKGELMTEIAGRQEADGGWSLSRMGDWKRHDDTPVDSRSDGYATGLTVYALKASGMSEKTAEMKRGIDWLVKNQNAADGLWPAYSLNKERDPNSDIGRFMSDAATGFSVMALESVKQ